MWTIDAKKLASACLKSAAMGCSLRTTGESPTLTHQEELKLYAQIKQRWETVGPYSRHRLQ